MATLPEILASVDAADRLLAERTLIVPLVSARDADLADAISTQVPGAFDFLIVDGVVLKETTLGGRSALELLGRATSSHLRSRRRVNSSLTALFADLAERFGHMPADGILIDLPLTHEILGGLVAARRSTVSLALQHVASTGVITRLDGDLWKLDRSILAA